METFDITYSKKNIPIPSKQQYKLKLIDKTESFIKRLRWKALAFLGKLEGRATNTYGFPTKKTPSVVRELIPFENDMMLLVKNIEFKRKNNEFQCKLNEDIREIKATKQLLVSADKSRNVYKVSKNDYDKLMHENVTKTYKKGDMNKVKNINRDAKKIASDLKLADRVEEMALRNCVKVILILPLKITKNISQTKYHVD